MRRFGILNRFGPISTTSCEELIFRSGAGGASQEKRQLKIFARYLCSLIVIASFGLMFSTSAFAQANGSAVINQIRSANTIINYARIYNVCSSTYIKNTTYLAECNSYLRALTSLDVAWYTKLAAGTLTVAYDTEVESALYDYEVALKGVLNAAGYSYTRSSVVSAEGDRSLAYQISSDEVSPVDGTRNPFSPVDSALNSVSPDSTRDTVICAACGTAAGAGYVICLTTIEVPIVALVCVVGVAATYVACAYDSCIAPPAPPTVCPS